MLQATDIVELISQSVTLKRRGKDFVGLCPFHNEKTPSFHVSPGKQFFHCYGCKAAGSVFDFVMKRDRVEFIDALKALAERAGLEMPQYGMSKEKAGEKAQLLEAQSAACAYFQQQLTHSDAGKIARDYLDQRGFTAESIKKFQIGVAPEGWDGLLSAMGRRFGPQLLATGGLVKPRQNGEGYYDTFRNRLMFPIRDENARVIAFGGRVLPGSEDPAKYLNSPETPLFSKSRCVFGLDLARQRIVETRTVAVVEGYTDVVMAHQYGVTNVVSILGTALTEQHLAILRRFADRVVLLFDADAAGDNAVNRAVELFLSQPVEIAIASIPEELDPDEYLLKYGAPAFDQLLATAADALEFKWKLLTKQHRAAGADVTTQQRAVEQYLDTIATARGAGGAVDPLRWGAILLRLKNHTGISVDELNKRFKNRGDSKRTSSQAAESNGSTALAPNRPLTARDRAERQILGALLAEPNRWRKIQETIHPEMFGQELNKALAEIYWDVQRNEGEPVFNEFLGLLRSESLRTLAVDLVGETDERENLDESVDEAIALFKELEDREKERKLTAQIVRKDDEVEALRKLQETRRQPDLRRAYDVGTNNSGPKNRDSYRR